MFDDSSELVNQKGAKPQGLHGEISWGTISEPFDNL